MDIHDLISLCEAYSKEGFSVHSQIDSVLSEEDLSDLNPNALKVIVKLFKKAEKHGIHGAEYYVETLEDHLKSIGQL